MPYLIDPRFEVCTTTKVTISTLGSEGGPITVEVRWGKQSSKTPCLGK